MISMISKIPINCSLRFTREEKPPTVSEPIIKYGDNIAGDTDLHTAVRQNNYTSLNNLLQTRKKNTGFNLHLNKLNEEGFTPFTLAILKFPLCIEFFLQFKNELDINYIFPIIETTVLTESIRENKKIIYKMLLARDDIDLNKFDLRTGLSPLIVAISKHNIDVSIDLLKDKRTLVNQHSYRVPINAQEDELYFPALMAIYYSFEEGINLLATRYDFNPNEKTKKLGISAIYFSLSKNKLTIFNLLLNLKEGRHLDLDINIQTKTGLTVLHYVAKNGFSTIMTRILSYQETNSNITTHMDKLTPLHLSVMNSKVECVDVLLSSYKVDLFIPSKNAGSAFMIANKQVNNLIKVKLINHFKKYYLINFEYLNTVNIRNLIDSGKFTLPDITKLIGYDLLKMILKIKPDVNYIQFNRAGFLYNEENNTKVCLARFSEKCIFVDLYDYDFFSEYILNSYSCPITNMPISNYFDFSDLDEFDKKCYVLSSEQFEYLGWLLS